MNGLQLYEYIEYRTKRNKPFKNYTLVNKVSMNRTHEGNISVYNNIKIKNKYILVCYNITDIDNKIELYIKSIEDYIQEIYKRLQSNITYDKFIESIKNNIKEEIYYGGNIYNNQNINTYSVGIRYKYKREYYYIEFTNEYFTTKGELITVMVDSIISNPIYPISQYRKDREDNLEPCYEEFKQKAIEEITKDSECFSNSSKRSKFITKCITESNNILLVKEKEMLEFLITLKEQMGTKKREAKKKRKKEEAK